MLVSLSLSRVTKSLCLCSWRPRTPPFEWRMQVISPIERMCKSKKKEMYDKRKVEKKKEF